MKLCLGQYKNLILFMLKQLHQTLNSLILQPTTLLIYLRKVMDRCLVEPLQITFKVQNR